jgi:predicted nucleotide-binding protein (sugar kinase/HSP70/actin superfamily)
MNERIKELERQAEKFVMGIPASLDINEYTSVFNEKFAELIVRECIGIVEKNESDMYYDNGMYPVYPTVCEIREHFGVEE